MNQTEHRMQMDGSAWTANGTLQMNDESVWMKYSPYSSQVEMMVPRKKHALYPPVNLPRYLG